MVKELEYPDSIVPEMYLSTGITNGLNVYLTTDKPIIAKQAAWPGNKNPTHIGREILKIYNSPINNSKPVQPRDGYPPKNALIKCVWKGGTGAAKKAARSSADGSFSLIVLTVLHGPVTTQRKPIVLSRVSGA